VSSSSSSDKLDYLGDDDVDWDGMHSGPDTTKHSHLAEGEIHVAALRTEPPFEETSTVEGILSFLNHHPPFFSPLINIV